jgi:PAS domain-containing protein
MADSDITRTFPGAPRNDRRTLLLEDTWLLTIFAVVLASALPWFVSAFNIDFVATSWALLALGAIYVAMNLTASDQRHATRAARGQLALLNAAGIIAMGFVWLHAGGLQNPVFLLAFVLPVIGSGSLSRWQPYLSATLAMLVVGAVAVSQDPELSWYAAGRWLVRLLGPSASAAGARGALLGFYAPMTYDVVLLEVFAILIFACAVMAESISNAFSRLFEHLKDARADAASSQQMWVGLLQALPLPALLIDAESLEIVQPSESMAPAFCSAGAELAGRELFEVVHFSDPESIQALIAGSCGSAPLMGVRLDDELRIVDVKVSHILRDGRRLALVLLLDATAAFCVGAALDVSEQAVFVLDPGGKLLASNRAAASLFPDALPPIAATADATAWWRPGFSGRRRLRVTLGGRNYQAVCTAVALSGESEALCVVALTVAPAAHQGLDLDLVGGRALGPRR